MKHILITLSILLTLQAAKAGEGMWLPLFLKSLNEAEMQELGMKITAEDIYSVNKGSLKDAIVHFGGFCTSELISGSGLLLTNHHCGYGQIQSHSSLDNNYLKNGFWAQSKADELMNPGLTATMINEIVDVTAQALEGVTDKMGVEEREATIKLNIESIRNSLVVASHQAIEVRPFFNGNQYFAFLTTTYRDVRLVGAPPESIGKFGADTDNWVWPRHTGDFSLFRIYAGPDNLPADPSEENIPYEPKHFLPISTDGVAEGDFTLVFGFPGRTQQYLPAVAVEEIIEVSDPNKIAIREKALNIIDKYMRSDEETRIKYASKFASVANYWKKWIGETTGLKKTGAISKKQKFEKEFVSMQTKDNPARNILGEFDALYAQRAPYAYVRDYYGEITGGRIVELMRVVGLAQRMTELYETRGAEAFDNFKGRVMGFLEGFYKNYDPAIDQEVFAALSEMYARNVEAKYTPEMIQDLSPAAEKNYGIIAMKLYSETAFVDKDKVFEMLEGDAEEVVARLQADPAYAFGAEWKNTYDTKVLEPYDNYNFKIDSLQRIYMNALMTTFPEKRFYPDANSTMRVTYGQVKSYNPSDAVTYSPVTYLDGVMEKYKPGDYEFDVDEKLLELYDNKDYGNYADRENGKMPVCFIGTNHTTGGNSGSPAIDAHGNLIGLNFDRAWEGTMSDLNYDASICRNIMVDARYILFVIDKYAGAGHLIEEMRLVRPKLEYTRNPKDEIKIQRRKRKANR